MFENFFWIKSNPQNKDTIFTKEAKLKFNDLFILYYVNQWYILMDLSRYAIQRQNNIWSHPTLVLNTEMHNHTEREMEHVYKGCTHHPIHYNLAITERN